MNKFSLTIALLFLLTSNIYSQKDSAQKVIIHGVVKNEKNLPISNAFIAEEGSEKGILTDSLGFFKLEVSPKAVLIVTADDYETLIRQIGNEDIVQLILRSAPKGNGNGINETFKQQTIANAFQDFSKSSSGNMYMGAAIPVFHQKDETKGSRYLFKQWVNGSVINNEGALISDESSLFNYDKMSRNLLFTKDMKNMITVDVAQIKMFTLRGNDATYRFVKKPEISQKDFIIELAGEPGKYSLCKTIRTKFEKADYKSDGLVETGKDYDEYVDENRYYVVFPDGKTVKPVEMKRKWIKETFKHEQHKVKAYFSDHRDSFVNETFLVGLVNSLNQ